MTRLLGILKHKTDLNLFLTCDSPFITRELLVHLVEEINDHDAIIPNDRKNMYPLTALYRKSSLIKLQGFFNTGNYKVREAVTSLELRQLPITSKSPLWNEKLFTNLNTFEDVVKAQV